MSVLTRAPDRFKAVTWNVYSGTPTKILEPVLNDQLNRGVTKFFMQEAQGNDITSMLIGRGLLTVSDGQFRFAWKPLNTKGQGWTLLGYERVHLSDTPFFAKGENDPIYSDALVAVFVDADGRSICSVCAHTPPFVQQPDSASTLKRRQILFESFARLDQLEDEHRCTAFLAALDMNVDPDTGHGAGTNIWDPIRPRATGLRIVQAPGPTHDRRSIDNFLIVPKRLGGLLRVVPRSGWVQDVPNPGDHHVHGEEFAWQLV